MWLRRPWLPGGRRRERIELAHEPAERGRSSDASLPIGGDAGACIEHARVELLRVRQ